MDKDKMSDPQDVGLGIFDLPVEGSCGVEHPRREGNYCYLEENHLPETHQDLDGNEWMGYDLE